MKKTLLFLAILYTQYLNAQTELVYFPTDEIITAPCPFDTTQTTSQLKDWLIYQTLDGTWNGVIDSSLCINVRAAEFNTAIDFSELNTLSPVFVRRIITDENKDWLLSDYLYSAFGGLKTPLPYELKTQEDCPNDFCTGLIIGIEIPDETGDESNVRYYNMTAFGAPNTYYGMGACLPTEYFEYNYLREFIFQIEIKESSSAESWVELYRNYLMASPNPGRIYDINIEEFHFQDTSYNIFGYEIAEDGTNAHGLLFMYNDTTYPSPERPSYIEAKLVSNVNSVQTINVIGGEQNFVFQPFTYLRGALIAGNDSLRHQVNLINTEGNMCLYYSAELIFHGNTHYYHEGGTISLEGKNSCLSFQYGASMNIAENIELYYGDNATGVIALGKNGHLNLAKNSTMHINNRFVLLEDSPYRDYQAYVDLQPGSQLIFDENATLKKNTRLENGYMKLNVYMNGGTLDDSNLTEEERLLINRIYPPRPIERLAQLNISPNPATDYLQIQHDLTLKNIRLVDALGKEVWNETTQSRQYRLDLAAYLTNGIYFVLAEDEDGQIFRQKVVVQR